MTSHLDENGDSEDVPSPGEGVADQERFYWDNRRLIQELDDDEAGRRERRRLKMEERKMHLRVRMHRYARRQDQGPLPEDLVLPPLQSQEDPYGHDVMDPYDERG
ncbi:hypothetical protein ACGFX8_24955 [Streptomyces sp. NPDC048362]|uniref:hypothetical protein n=1 Tax=Streptomyces sp. NPDC048362 TaxID=3365539 RepID=UPI003720F3F9